MLKFLFPGLLFFSIQVNAQSSEDLKLWYDKPAGDTWENALPLGNGRIGAMVYGNVPKDIFQLNEHTVWSGSPNRNDNPDALEALPEVRELLFNKEYKAAEELANEKIITKKSNGQMFQPVGNLELTFPGQESYTDYYRELDISSAISKTTYSIDGITYTREAFTSLPDHVLVIHLTADQPGKVTFEARFTSPHVRQNTGVNDSGQLSLWGMTGDHEGVKGGVAFNALMQVKAGNGAVSASDKSIVVSGADEATLLVSIATNFTNYHDLGGDEKVRAHTVLEPALTREYKDLKAAHIREYQRYFNRVSLNFGEATASGKPTDVRLADFRTSVDPSFVALYFQYGRYLLISASQPGGQPATLQGIWNNNMTPPWDSKYTININTEMNYWPVEKTNLSALHEPLLRMVQELATTGKETARVMYGARGWMAHHNTDIWRITGPVDGAFWGIWNGGGGWLSQHLWEHFLYTGDTTWLESVYPVLKGAALFYKDFLVPLPDSPYLVVVPGNSPENAPAAHQGSSLTAGSTMDNQLVFDVFSTAIRSAELLGKDQQLADSLRMMRKELPPMRIGRHNQLQEWMDDVDDPDDHHRHISHLYGLFPSNQISPYRTPQLFAAARNTLIQRGDVSTGWSMGWKVNWWAHMMDGDHAFKLIRDQLSPVGTNKEGGGTYDNLFDAHPPFQIDGNFGCTSGITEMLMQSSDGTVHLLPALPDALSEGSVTGLKARGGFEIAGMEWKEKKLKTVTIVSRLGGNLRLRVPNAMELTGKGKLQSAEGINPNPYFFIPDTAAPVVSTEADLHELEVPTTLVYDLPTTKGQSYILKIKEAK